MTLTYGGDACLRGSERVGPLPQSATGALVEQEGGEIRLREGLGGPGCSFQGIACNVSTCPVESSGADDSPRRNPLPASGARARATMRQAFGMITASITWMTPLSALTSVIVTTALSAITLPPSDLMVIDCPSTVFTIPGFTSLAMTVPGTT